MNANSLISLTLVILSLNVSASSGADNAFRFTTDQTLKTYIDEENTNHLYEQSLFKNSLSQEQYEKFFPNNSKMMPQKKITMGKQTLGHNIKTITIDTRNQDACLTIKEKLEKQTNKDYKDLCMMDPDSPYVSISSIDKERTELRHYISRAGVEDDGSHDDRNQKLMKQTRNFIGLGVGVVGLIYALPEDVSNWDKEDIKNNWSKRWVENVSNKPVVDEDDWMLNYIGHPISGAAYHVIARHAGFNKWESFGYSVFMSTVFWEYGLESLAERPSIQDLILTPLIGSLLGELFYSVSQQIDDNDGKVLNSEGLGTVVQGLMNPAQPFLNFVNNVFDNRVFDSADSYFYAGERSLENVTNITSQTETQFGITFEFKY